VQELGDCRHRRWLMTGPLELVVGWSAKIVI
jgi:hypothetical protein